MFDRIEAPDMACIRRDVKGRILIENVPFESMEVPLLHLNNAGIDFLSSSNSIYIGPECLNNDQVESFELACGAHPE